MATSKVSLNSLGYCYLLPTPWYRPCPSPFLSAVEFQQPKPQALLLFRQHFHAQLNALCWRRQWRCSSVHNLCSIKLGAQRGVNFCCWGLRTFSVCWHLAQTHLLRLLFCTKLLLYLIKRQQPNAPTDTPTHTFTPTHLHLHYVCLSFW